jgi:hypothetical protein
MLEGLPLVRSVGFHGGYLDWPSYQRLSFRDTRSHLLANQERSTLPPLSPFSAAHNTCSYTSIRLETILAEGGRRNGAVRGLMLLVLLQHF